MGGMGGMGSYGGSYGGYGSYGSSMGGGYGSYSRLGSGMYGGAQGGYGGGYGSYGGGYGGMMGNGTQPGFESGTAATFQLIESIVGAFAGFSQMLESTYMATHSSFFAMVSVAEQVGHLRNSLGSILGIYALLRWFKKIIARVQGKQLPDEKTAEEKSDSINAENFAKFQGANQDKSRPPLGARPSYTPLLFFLAAVFGLPYLITKLIRAAAQQEQQALLINGHGDPSQSMFIDPHSNTPIDPSQLEFCRALFDFIPENPHIELELHEGDLVAILSKEDPSGQPSQWWRVQTRDGRSGFVPSTFVEILPRQIPESRIKVVEDTGSS